MIGRRRHNKGDKRWLAVRLLFVALFLSSSATAAASRGKDGVRRVQLSDGTVVQMARCVSARQQLASPRTEWDANRTYRVPVVLVSFPDCDFSMEHPQATYDSLFNVPGYNRGHGPGCVADYFRDQSRGLFNLRFDVVGPVKLPTSCRNSSGSNTNNGTAQLCAAADSAKAYLHYADYDWDGLGNVAQVLFVYAGYGGNESGKKAEGRIWPNTGTFSTLSVSGTRVSRYSASAERWTNDALCGIGTICHEFSHCLGLPDFYPTSGDEYSVVDEWDLMDGGNFTDDGWCPPNYSAHERDYVGWLSPTELLTTTSVSRLLPVAQGGEAYRITSNASASEYYLLENRQREGWDFMLPGHGLIVAHVDYSQGKWTGNTVNTDPAHHRYDFFYADNHNYSYYESLYAGKNHIGPDGRNLRLQHSAFPYVTDTLEVRELTDTSAPAATLFPKTYGQSGPLYMGKPIKNITEKDGLVSFDFYESEADGISVPVVHAGPSALYRMDGRRVARPTSGVYIRRRPDGSVHKEFHR